MPAGLGASGIMSRYRWLLTVVVLTLNSACTSGRVASAPPVDFLNPPNKWTLIDLPGAHAGVTLSALRRSALTPPARYQVVVVPGSGCTGWAPVAERYFAGLLHAELLVLHKPGVTISAGLSANCTSAFTEQDTLSSWKAHAQAALTAHFSPSESTPGKALPVLLVGISEGAELLPLLAESIPLLAGGIMLAAPGLPPREAGELQAQRNGHGPAWLALQKAQASDAPDNVWMEGRTLGYWRDFWHWEVTQPLMDATWPLLRVWGDADELIPFEAYHRFGERAQTRTAPFCDWRLPGANHGLQTPAPSHRDGVQWLWARLEIWARHPSLGLCANFLP